MKPSFIVGIIFLVICGRNFGQENYRGGIVYGPKAAFNIGAPEGWVLDNESGKEHGLPCVLYPKGDSWADARTVMYAKIASTQYRRRKRIRRSGDQRHEENARNTEGEDCVR